MLKNRVWIISDEGKALAGLPAALEAMGFEKLTASSFSSAHGLAPKLHECFWDLSLIVVHAGSALVKALGLLWTIKNNRRCRSIPVMLITEEESLEQTMRAYNLGADYVLCQPLNASQLRYGLELLFAAERPAMPLMLGGGKEANMHKNSGRAG